MPKVMIATPFRHITSGNSELEIGGATAGETLGNLAEEYPDLRTVSLYQRWQAPHVC